jgi:hypothetical protein
MPAGMPYFAWVDPSETVFAPEHLRWDESIFSFTLAQSEGDPASLTVVVRRPRNEAGDAIGLLGPGRKIWCWFSFDCGPNLIRFRGRLVGVPTSLFEELVTLEFVARPVDLVAQKEALAETLRVLPYYDEVVIDKDRRKDPEVVLEGYSAIWHYDRETHVLTVSDEITGEDGLVEFDGASEEGTVLYDGLGLTLTSGPLARVDVKAEYSWTQQAQGKVDLTKYILDNWVGPGVGVIRSLSMSAEDWPKTGATLGDGWIAAEATAYAQYSHQTITTTGGGTMKVVFPDTSWFGPSTTTTTYSWTRSAPDVGPGSFGGPRTITDKTTVQHAKETLSGSEEGFDGASLQVNSYVSSYSRNYSEQSSVTPINYIVPTLVAGYTAKRQCTEVVSLSLYADAQHILTDPEDGEALRVDGIRSVNLSEAVGEGTDSYLPIGDPRRRSYIATERGNQSAEHLIALARAHLLKRARVVEIAFAPKLSRMPEITLRKNAFLAEPRLGEALGKIIAYSLALDGADGKVKCEVKIGCAIGLGGSAVAAGGEPTYAEVAYTGADYQQFTGRTVLFDTSVGYQPPLANPNDDGINFLSVLRPEDVIAIPLTVSLAEVATFKLKSMTREFSSDYDLQVTDLKIPTGYNLEAV